MGKQPYSEYILVETISYSALALTEECETAACILNLEDRAVQDTEIVCNSCSSFISPRQQ